jgi:effector-binding domain-containing protein
MSGTDDWKIVALEPAATAVVRGVVPMAELPQFFDRSFGLIGEVLADQGITPIAPAFALYHGPPSDTADVELGFPTDHPVEPVGDVVASTLPGGQVATMTHRGSYDDLGDTWGRLYEAVMAQGATPAGAMWEVYVTEPTPDMNPDDLRTELHLPLSG